LSVSASSGPTLDKISARCLSNSASSNMTIAAVRFVGSSRFGIPFRIRRRTHAPILPATGRGVN
jgi:hypothetical protein